MENANSLGDLRVVPTGEAANLLGLRPQTLRKWATYGGPIKPVKIGGRLGWPASDLKRLLRGE